MAEPGYGKVSEREVAASQAAAHSLGYFLIVLERTATSSCIQLS